MCSCLSFLLFAVYSVHAKLFNQIHCIVPPINTFMEHSLFLHSIEAILLDTIYVNRYAITKKMETKFNKASIVKVQLLHEHSADAWNISTIARRKNRTIKSIKRHRWEYEQNMHAEIFGRVSSGEASVKVPQLYHTANESFFICEDFSRQYEYGIATMEYIDSMDLWTVITEKTDVPLVAAVRQSALSLASLHSLGIIHGDYHTPNILLFNNTNKRLQAAAIDFTYSSVFVDAASVPCELIYEDISYFLDELDDLDTWQAYQAYGIFTDVICHDVTYSCTQNDTVFKDVLLASINYTICDY